MLVANGTFSQTKQQPKSKHVALSRRSKYPPSSKVRIPNPPLWNSRHLQNMFAKSDRTCALQTPSQSDRLPLHYECRHCWSKCTISYLSYGTLPYNEHLSWTRWYKKTVHHVTPRKTPKHMETPEKPSVKHRETTTPTTCALQEEKGLVESKTPTCSAYWGLRWFTPFRSF